jgi:hypothetical protein
MFSSLRTSQLAQRALGAADLARSFLMLEDDECVDWEVDRSEPIAPVHPHRAPLRRPSYSRRPGAAPVAPQICVSPTFYGRPATRGIAGAERESEQLSARRGSRAGRTETRAARDRHGKIA